MRKIDNPRNGIDIFKNYWRGHGKLLNAYFGYGFVGTFILYFFGMLGSLFLLPFTLEEGKSILESKVFSVYIVILMVVLLAWQIVVWILIWRNAKNASHSVWGYVAKFAVLSGIVGLVREIIENI